MIIYVAVFILCNISNNAENAVCSSTMIAKSFKTKEECEKYSEKKYLLKPYCLAKELK